MNERAFVRGAESLFADYVHLTTGQSALLVYDRDVEPVCRRVGAIAIGAGIEVVSVSAALDWTAIETPMKKQCDAVVFLESDQSHHTQRLLQFLRTARRPPRAYRMFGATAETISTAFKPGRERTLKKREPLHRHEFHDEKKVIYRPFSIPGFRRIDTLPRETPNATTERRAD